MRESGWKRNSVEMANCPRFRRPFPFPAETASISIQWTSPIPTNSSGCRALIWPEHVERHRQLIDAAIEFARTDIHMHAGDASQVLPTLIESIPLEQALVVYSTIALYQFPRESRARIADTLVAASSTRPVWQIALEGNDPELSITRYRRGVRSEAEILADASPHGWWIEWRERESPQRGAPRRL